MTSLNNRLRDFGLGLSQILPNCYHYWRSGMVVPYVVWAEIGEQNALSANDRKQEQAIDGSVHLFTKTEFDPLIDTLQQYFNTVAGLSWYLESVQFEDETGLIHYEWGFVIG